MGRGGEVCGGRWHEMSLPGYTHTHRTPLPPRALGTQPPAAAVTHLPRASGSRTPSSAWWASPRPLQVGLGRGACTCHGAARAGGPAAPRRGLSCRGTAPPTRGSVATGSRRGTPAGGGRRRRSGDRRAASVSPAAPEGRARGAEPGSRFAGSALTRSSPGTGAGTGAPGLRALPS